MGKYDGAEIEVVNWTEYNPRTDSKRPSWFRFENVIATGSGFFGLDCEQKWLWVVILSLVSQSNGTAITWNSAYVTSMTGISPEKQDRTIEIFEKFSRLRVSRKVTQRDSPATNERTNERTNEHTRAGEKNLAPEVTEAKDRWRGVLKHFGCDRELIAHEEYQLASAIQRHGSANVFLALEGARTEPKTDGFDPGAFLSLSRVLDVSKFSRFVTLGAKSQNKESARKAKEAEVTASRDAYVMPVDAEPPQADPIKFKELMAKALSKMPA